MFADISGFTALSEAMDPEDLHNLMNACFETLVPIITRFGGTVDKYIGDEIMALFGAPVAHENDAERAVRAAITMRESLLRFNKEHDTHFGIHFGINSGMVISGLVGAKARKDYSVMGDAVVVAKRLEEESKSGQILVGEDIFFTSGRFFEFNSIGALALKGKSTTVNAYEALRISKNVLPPVKRHQVVSPLVGRDRERDILTRRLDALRHGEGGILAITGRAGTGKSRLVAEVRRDIVDKDILWVEGKSISLDLSVRYLPFQEMVHRLAGTKEDDSERRIREKLIESMFTIFPADATKYLPFVFTLMAIGLSDEYRERIKRLDAEAIRRQIYITTRTIIRRTARLKPLWLIFEDVHWMDASSRELLVNILDLVCEVPVLITIITRPDENDFFEKLSRKAARDFPKQYLHIPISNILPGEQEGMLSNLMGHELQETNLFKQVIHRSGGNPFFMEEIVRSLIAQEALVWNESAGRWQLTAKADTYEIPHSVRGVIMSRIDRLDKELQKLIKTAAVIGRSFLFRLLKNVADSGEPIDEQLDELLQSELIQEKRRDPELEFAFKHALTQETAYESLLVKKRRKIHRLVGQCIERLFQSRLEEFSCLLAYHFTHAEDWEKAQRYLFRAADQAGSIAADDEALDLYKRAMEAYQRFFGDQWTPFEKAVLKRKIGMALFRKGQLSQSLEYLKQSLRLLGYHMPESKWGIRWAILTNILRQFFHRMLPWLFVRKEADGENPSIPEMVHLLETIAWMDLYTNNEQYLLSVLVIMNKVECSPVRTGSRSTAYSGTAAIATHLGIHSVARLYASLARSALRKEVNPLRFAIYELVMAFHADASGEWDRAIEHYSRSARLFDTADDIKRWSMPLSSCAELHFQRGNFEQSTAFSREVADVGRDSGDDQMVAWGEGLWARNLSITGNIDEALPTMIKSIKHLLSVPDYQIAALFQGYLGDVLLRSGNLEEALRVQQKNVELLRSKNIISPYVPVCLNRLTEAYIALSDSSEKEKKKELLLKAKISCARAMREAGKFAIGLPCSFRNRATLYYLQGQEQKAIRYWDKSIEAAQSLKAPYLAALAFLEMGRRTRDEDCIDHAIMLLQRIGASNDLDNANKAKEKLLASI